MKVVIPTEISRTLLLTRTHVLGYGKVMFFYKSEKIPIVAKLVFPC